MQMCEVWHNLRRRWYIKLRTATAIGYRDQQYTTGNNKKNVLHVFSQRGMNLILANLLTNQLQQLGISCR